MGVFSGWTTSEIKRLALYLKDAIGWSSQPEDIQRIFNMIVDAAIAREDLDKQSTELIDDFTSTILDLISRGPDTAVLGVKTATAKAAGERLEKNVEVLRKFMAESRPSDDDGDWN